jgi:hypothetical protein
MGESTVEGNTKKLKLLFSNLTKESPKKLEGRKKIHCN